MVQFKMLNRVIKFTVLLPDQRKYDARRLEQAERQRWRALLLVLKAKLEAVESGIAIFESEFLANIVIDRAGHTVGDVLPEQIATIYAGGMAGRLMLGPAADVDA